MSGTQRVYNELTLATGIVVAAVYEHRRLSTNVEMPTVIDRRAAKICLCRTLTRPAGLSLFI